MAALFLMTVGTLGSLGSTAFLVFVAGAQWGRA